MRRAMSWLLNGLIGVAAVALGIMVFVAVAAMNAGCTLHVHLNEDITITRSWPGAADETENGDGIFEMDTNAVEREQGVHRLDPGGNPWAFMEQRGRGRQNRDDDRVAPHGLDRYRVPLGDPKE